MNILHTVEFYNPSVGGAQEVIKQISEGLVRRGHSVTVATTRLPNRKQDVINGVRIEEFGLSGNAVNGYHGNPNYYQQFLLESHFDIMMNYAAQQWATDLVFPVLAQLQYLKILIPCGFSGLYFPKYSNYFEEMPGVLAQYDHLIFHANSYRDIDFARQYKIDHFTMIPNGASQREFEQFDPTFRQRYGIAENEPLLLNVSTHTRAKGHRLTISAFQKARIGRSTLIIVGNVHSGKGCLPDCRRRARLVNISTLGKKRVFLLDIPRNEVVNAYHAANLFIYGSNVEYSPLVLFEALASKTPFITTACGNAEEIVEWSKGGIVLPKIHLKYGMIDADPRAMANAIEGLISNPVHRQNLAENGHIAWQQSFTWERIIEKYEKLYQNLLDEPRANQLL